LCILPGGHGGFLLGLPSSIPYPRCEKNEKIYREFCDAVSNSRVSLVVHIERIKNMQYLLLIYEPEKRFANGFPDGEFAEYSAFGQKHASVIKGGNALQPTGAAKTVRVRNGEATTTDGPFAETKEQLGGYYLVEANSPDEATKMAAGIPAARYGSIEVRPIMVFS
jgi:hypothetical protein